MLTYYRVQSIQTAGQMRSIYYGRFPNQVGMCLLPPVSAIPPLTRIVGTAGILFQLDKLSKKQSMRANAVGEQVNFYLNILGLQGTRLGSRGGDGKKK